MSVEEVKAVGADVEAIWESSRPEGVQSAVDTAKKKPVVLIVAGMLRFCWLGQLVWEVCFFLDGIQSRSKRKL